MISLPDEIRQFCRNHGLRLNTDLGQHFLLDGSILDRIIETAQLRPVDTVVEIGPGVGVLTRELLKFAGSVIAIELDARMIPLLREFTGRDPKLNVVQGNALQIAMPESPYKVVANIPYHITSPLLRHLFLESKKPPTSLTLLIQREVAERICDTKDAGMLTILVGLFGTPKIVARVPPDAFLPPPKVDSAVLHIACFAEPLADGKTIERLFKLTKIGFGQKRKMLRNTLGTFQGVAERLAGLGIEQSRRPQTLSVQEWIALARAWPDDRDG
ncbi:MAG TPA: ribosomal RNA small subunit methyltransferase A [Candidatus Peribacter riflensis]|uniref:Ribosomal RNA small subunit methyltransferase A n=1 Tax=Candidatus Peribacter riflensis TaxID=1735162 RepID=A0A0S1SI22_9BACT|nr:MAG: 16S rRNA (adenine1518-N6/adenine1519-N6)-dimethyltransferase [Candidatus Peribacter riflensis]OGJ77820.1 MAG: ribosomal RNA small subunit methyltransferase A [Candidatus Peribacteria bacterium RIFOXYB1_FULL_57_12]OGJ82780.1 MAG: ribosomal RNA small subunit methyltransferase A [Candidatus Peribacteria bacterium RIFOXYC1_FULL_58_8]ALM11239.1 MAG: dimethyladenosine transferase [Candidatus Peribacter riflensis]ALM12341.1 MAG: 16S rRNA (adenine1518-N6/adenine1519-N6)-dimethyltransferase [Can